ncbi:immunoglobulin superfamily member 1 [Ictalurus punctatus]|uniref:immunoglobulin superfamily member 1 n=1 Tax=Ictalurus punctatus TaxID=7998 RepID=UPI0023530B93|nr:immunoglobulin superfamily member 1 [Ictalurus punctatus]
MDTCHTTIYIYLMIATSVSPSEGDTLEIFPAQIFGPSTAKVGENLELKCLISNIQSSNTEIHMYLCKNGVGERLEIFGNKTEHTFTLRNISLRDSGTYSCVYSFTRYLPKNVTGSGMNSILVRVTGDALKIFPAQIFGPSAAKVGENVALTCSISNIQRSNTEVHVYLVKNGVGERLEIFGNKNEHTFTLRNISLRDSGTYSCVYSFIRYLPKNVTRSGMNSIRVRVTDLSHEVMVTETYDPLLERNILRLVFSVGVIIFACFIVIFDFKTRSRSSRKFTSSDKAKDRNNS